jgi:UDP-2,3-diacylglucosamine pyrophosphatase LpxH
MTLHDRLLTTLEAAADVSLVSKLRDPRLHLPDDTRLNVFIPDLHLVTDRRSFRYRTNAPETLTAVARALRGFKIAAAPAQVVVYQLGDFLDLWREADGLDPGADVASAIEDAHTELLEALYDPALDTQFLLGNHDYDLYRFPNYDLWQRSIRVQSSMLALHGDIFDWIEEMPDRLQNLLVYLFSPDVKAARAQLGAMRPLNTAMRARSVGPAAPSPVRALIAPYAARASDRFNVQDAQSPPVMLKFLDSARRKCAEFTMVVIGHTHHARIAVHEEGDNLFALVDCGAWTEDCVTEDDPTPRPNAQIAAIGANEIRIYQLAERSGG